jgi:hypothetical protein
VSPRYEVKACEPSSVHAITLKKKKHGATKV